MAKTRVFSDAHIAYLRHLYIAQSIQPTICAQMVNEKFGTRYTIQQIRRAVTERGWSAKRKAVKLAGQQMVEKSVTEIARDHTEAMTRFVKQSAAGVEKAAGMIERARDVRTLSSAASAFKTLVTTYRLCAGLDNASSTRTGHTFNFNFTNVAPTEAKQAERAGDVIEV